MKRVFFAVCVAALAVPLKDGLGLFDSGAGELIVTVGGAVLIVNVCVALRPTFLASSVCVACAV